jgi:hypothetical protein
MVCAVHCKKRLAIFLSQAWLSLTKSRWPGIIKFFPAKKSLVCDMPARDGKMANLFLQCIVLCLCCIVVVCLGVCVWV